MFFNAIYYFFRDSFLEFSTNIYSFIRSIFERLFNRLNEVKVDVDAKNNIYNNRNVLVDQKRNLEVMKANGTDANYTPKYNDHDWYYYGKILLYSILILATIYIAINYSDSIKEYSYWAYLYVTTKATEWF
uniref:Uncharacterized protein n=1 Tax=Coniferiporia sulphurascens TaxID=175648 RepID=A0A5B9R9N8_CONSH|nr:hypothetical protein PSUO_000065 [Coniferiporia sulphurascens]QEG57158.1 hypothetical protein PSUO_000065 [Coniferiporia sulphurascens]